MHSALRVNMILRIFIHHKGSIDTKNAHEKKCSEKSYLELNYIKKGWRIKSKRPQILYVFFQVTIQTVVLRSFSARQAASTRLFSLPKGNTPDLGTIAYRGYWRLVPGNPGNTGGNYSNYNISTPHLNNINSKQADYSNAVQCLKQYVKFSVRGTDKPEINWPVKQTWESAPAAVEWII